MVSKYTIAFPGNAGETEQLSINIQLDGNRATLFTNEATSTLAWYIFSNGFYGENNDMVPDLCAGVLVTLNSATNAGETYDFLDGLTAAETILLKNCLGDANGDATDNVVADVYNWDYGSKTNPHLIKLIDATQDLPSFVDTDVSHAFDAPNQYQVGYLCAQGATTYSPSGVCAPLNPPGFYVAVWFDAATTSTFRLFSRASNDYGAATTFHVYTTTGYLKLVSESTQAFNTWGNAGNQFITNLLTNTLYTRRNLVTGSTRDGLDCETVSSTSLECLKKEDYMMVFNTGRDYQTVATTAVSYPLTYVKYAANPIYHQIYKVKKISNEPVPQAKFALTNGMDWTAAQIPTFVRNQIVVDKAFNVRYHLDPIDPTADSSASVFKFYPPTNQFNYAAQCSNRGICSKDTGLCGCFSGFTGDNCANIDALAH
jgi:hypothetical protein